jgi:hypothetical protein
VPHRLLILHINHVNASHGAEQDVSLDWSRTPKRRITTDINSSLRSQKASPIPSLPGVLRNRIYEYVLCHQVWDIDDHDRLIRPAIDLRHAMGFSKVCRQVRAETFLWAFSRSTFSVGSELTFADFIKGLTHAQIEAIQQVNMPLSNFYNTSDHSFVELGYKGLGVLLPLSNMKRIPL